MKCDKVNGCTQTVEGYFISKQDNQIGQCSQTYGSLCLQCNSMACTKSQEQYFINLENNQIQKCSTKYVQCQTCGLYGEACQRCYESHILKDKKC